MPSEKFSARLSIAARATPGLSSFSGSRPTIMRDGLAADRQPAGIERIGHCLDMLGQALLRQKR